MEKLQNKLTKIAGDASFRQFYRLKKGKKTSIIVKAKKEKFKNLVLYSAINKFLRQRKILAPKLINFFFYKGVIEIEDFGDVQFSQYIKGKKNKLKAYKKAVKFLIKIQKIKPQKTINLLKPYKIKLDYYDVSNLHKESDLFFNWYLVGILGSKKGKNFKNLIRKELDKIYKKIYFKNSYFVHRDFHISNLMLIKGKIGILDSQDAIIGNPIYDLVSLVDDVRIRTSISLKEKIFNFYLSKTSKNLNKKVKQLKNDFNILSIQRNLKILGIFYRLFKRDKKKHYLKFMPYTWKLIEVRLRDDMFKNLKLLLNKAVSKKQRTRVVFR